MTNEAAGSRAPRFGPWYVKLAYVVASCALVYLVAGIPTGPGGGGILRCLLAFVLILLGARLFRGAGEEIAPPRPWWRMTAGVPSGVVLGSVFALVAFLSAAGYVGLAAATIAHKDVTDLPVLLLNVVLCAVLAFLFFGSSRRLVLARRTEAIAAARGSR